MSQVARRVAVLAAAPREALVESKRLVMWQRAKTLEEVQMRESQVLMERWGSQECAQAVMKFMQRKSKM